MRLLSPCPMRMTPTCKVVNLSNRYPTVPFRAGLRGPSQPLPLLSLSLTATKKGAAYSTTGSFGLDLKFSPRIFTIQ
jgi:hypothetical protein